MTNTVVKILFGSHLYGTDTEKSDKDFKGVYLPSKEDCYLNRVSKSFSENSRSTKTHGEKNTKDDVDFEIYSLQYFLFNMGRSGDTTFLDMVHAPRNCILETSDIWEYIRSNRNLFYTKNLKSYLGYCRTQAAKYGIKGSRLEEAESVLEVLKSYKETWPSPRVSSILDYLPSGNHIKRYDFEDARSSGDIRCYDVCGKKLMANTPISEAIKSMEIFVNNYGSRAKLAKTNEGIDWKAISHAFRVGYQMKSLYTCGDIVFPLQEKDFLIKLKTAEFHYMNDGIADKLENLIEEVENLANKSSYPEQVNMDPWEKFTVNCYK